MSKHISKRELIALNSIGVKVHEVALEHGWWEGERNIGEVLCLIHSEVSEALESDRNGGKSEEFAEELADIIIRVLDLATHMNLNIGYALLEKNERNIERPYKHNKRY